MPNAAVTLAQAATELGISRRQLERDVRNGAPVAKHGRRGAGHTTLVYTDAVRAWRGARDSSTDGPCLLAFASEIPEIIAAAAHETFLAMTGPHKRATAAALAEFWYRASCALADRLRTNNPDVPEVVSIPDKIDTLRRISRDL